MNVLAHSLVFLITIAHSTTLFSMDVIPPKKHHAVAGTLLFSGFTLDDFYDYEMPDDEKLKTTFSDFHDKLIAQRKDDEDLLNFLRNEIDAQGQYLRARPELAKLKAAITAFISKSEVVDTEAAIEGTVAKLLEIISAHKSALEYLSPILRKHQHLIHIYSDQKTAMNKAISFFFHYIINGYFLEEKNIYFQAKIGRLTLKMILGSDASPIHKDFLARQSAIAIDAYRHFDRIAEYFDRVPELNPQFAASFSKQIKSIHKPKQSRTKVWLKTHYPMSDQMINVVYDAALISLKRKKPPSKALSL